jgi:hypothetical protein
METRANHLQCKLLMLSHFMALGFLHYEVIVRLE